MPITSVLGRLTHREHKACKSEGFLKAASHLMLKDYLSQKQKTFFFNKTLVFFNSKRLRIEQLWTLRCSFCLLLPCLPSQWLFNRWKFSSLHWQVAQHLVSPTFIKTCIYQLWLSHTPVNPPDEAVSCHMPRTFISLVPAVFGVCEGVSPKQWLPSPQPHLSCSSVTDSPSAHEWTSKDLWWPEINFSFHSQSSQVFSVTIFIGITLQGYQLF